MRGKDVVIDIILNGDRITPAYAGKSIERRIISKQTKDHPRLCGEKAKAYDGTLPEPRITPAYAGKSIQNMSMVNGN